MIPSSPGIGVYISLGWRFAGGLMARMHEVVA
eukprot:CAMPEP_0117661100 /NCGR_PEP_ID=MMETSP0804-20121206/7361_1 /TAXON_ID=1074897 /ORGANISM="Tetraselmis astigmatica, Strain CCMP880" /LENGTH=31 /DNA_ID= /DNA_START= /DNA_END= /DNA_ORIENTATION=